MPEVYSKIKRKMSQQVYNNDHDLLIAMHERLGMLSGQVERLSDSNTKEIAGVKIDLGKLSSETHTAIKLLADTVNQALATKADKKEQEEVNDDHESRVRDLEQFRWKALGIVAAIQFLIGAGLLTLMQ